jgi:hypothetical protein
MRLCDDRSAEKLERAVDDGVLVNLAPLCGVGASPGFAPRPA